jgi:hypothetical protein
MDLTAAIGDENADRAPAILAERSSAMQRRRFKHVLPFLDNLTQEAERLRAEAEKLPPGTERQRVAPLARSRRRRFLVEYLLGEGGRNITGTVLTVDAGNTT